MMSDAFPETMSLDAAFESWTEKQTDPSSDVRILTKNLVRADEAAWKEFHALYAQRLFRYLLVILDGNETQASDALQSTFVRAARYVRPMSDEATLWSWLTVLARSAAFDDARKRSRLARFLERFQKSAAPMVSICPGSADDRLLEKLESGLARLDESDRALLTGKYIQGTSVRDLAEAGGLSEKAVESRLTRARRRLRLLILAELKAEKGREVEI